MLILEKGKLPTQRELHHGCVLNGVGASLRPDPHTIH